MKTKKEIMEIEERLFGSIEPTLTWPDWDICIETGEEHPDCLNCAFFGDCTRGKNIMLMRDALKEMGEEVKE